MYGMIHYLILQMQGSVEDGYDYMQLAFIGKIMMKEKLAIAIMQRQISNQDLMKLNHVKP